MSTLRQSEAAAKPPFLAIGLMSGTSLDGVDAACVEIADLGEVRLRGFTMLPFPADLRARVAALCENGRVEDLAVANFELGELFANAAQAVIAECGLQPDEIAVIGSHGQTVSHLPARGDAGNGVTLQIGEPSIIAERTGITTIADFRPRDMAAGGQGAPLVPFADYWLLRQAERHRIVQNIGGIANLTWLPAGGAIEQVRAWDTGPGNMVIDECVRILTKGAQEYDQDGVLAAQGRVDGEWLETLMAHPYFTASPPKSAGREEFGRAYTTRLYQEGVGRGLDGYSVIATVTALTARSIAQACATLLNTAELNTAESRPCEIILGGGGAYNPTLRAMLQKELAARLERFSLHVHEDFGIRSDAKEAIAFALLAYATLHVIPNNVPGATGAARPLVLGKIVPGRLGVGICR